MLQIHLYFVAKGRVTEEALATNIKIGGGGEGDTGRRSYG